MTIEHAWDAVLALQNDVERIVSQAVRAGRVRDDYTATDGMSYCVELLVASREPIRDVAAYVLASLRRELRFDLTHVTDALDRARLTGTATAINEQLDGDGSEDDSDTTITAKTASGEQTANRATAEPQDNFAVLEFLTPQENRVAGLVSSGMDIPAIGRKLGLQPHRVRTILGIAASKANKWRMEKTESPAESTS